MATTAQKITVGKACWHVRNEQGERFGPVGFETLKAWASDGRLAPTNEVSETGMDWHLATAQRGLEMDWVAEVTPGTFYGPIHHAAMEELSKEGSLAGQASFFVRSRLDARQEHEVRIRQAEQARLKLAEQLDAAQGRLSELDRQAQQVRNQLSTCEGELTHMRQEHVRAGESLVSAQTVALNEQAQRFEVERQTLLATAQADHVAQATALSEQAQRFEAERQTLQAVVRRAEADVVQGATRMAELEGALAGAEQAAEKRVQGLSDELAALKTELAEVKQASQQARAQAEVAAEALETVRCELADETRLTSTLKNEIATVKKERAAAQRRNEEARALARQAFEALGAAGETHAVEETLATEPQERERAYTPSTRAKSTEPLLEAEVLPPERLKPTPEKPPVVSYANRAKPGLSLAELEQQARRELERLGAQGKTFFVKKK